MSGHVVTVTFTIKPSAVSSFMDAMTTQAATSLAEEVGCRQFDVCVDPTDACRVFLYEIYDDKAAFAAHLASHHFRAFDTETRGFVRDKQVSVWVKKSGSGPS